MPLLNDVQARKLREYLNRGGFLVLDDFLNKLAKTPLQVQEIFNDRMSYFHTFVQWAKNFDAHKDFVIGKFGEFVTPRTNA